MQAILQFFFTVFKNTKDSLYFTIYFDHQIPHLTPTQEQKLSNLLHNATFVPNTPQSHECNRNEACVTAL
jgi:hypothetical protein